MIPPTVTSTTARHAQSS